MLIIHLICTLFQFVENCVIVKHDIYILLLVLFFTTLFHAYTAFSILFLCLLWYALVFLCDRKNGMDLYAVKSNSKRTHYLGVFKRKRCVFCYFLALLH